MDRIQNARWADESKTSISCLIDGRNSSIPASRGNADYNELLASGTPILDYTPPAPSANDFSGAIQSHVDDLARQRGYADGVAFAGYATSTVPAWSTEATDFIKWRDQVWLYAYGEMDKVMKGQRPMPTVEMLISELPKIVWTQQ